jgi:hypothetical protein
MVSITEGPPLESLTRRLAETPADFLDVTHVDVAAIVSDLLRALGGELLDESRARPIVAGDGPRVTLILISSWLLYDSWFRDARRFAAAAYELLALSLDRLVDVVEPQQFISDSDRREELVRVVLQALDLRPQGESDQQAADRLNTLDSVERVRVLRDTRDAQKRIRKVQEAMKKKAAEEAAASYGRE